jgi:hypothetical protein
LKWEQVIGTTFWFGPGAEIEQWVLVSLKSLRFSRPVWLLGMASGPGFRRGADEDTGSEDGAAGRLVSCRWLA